MSEKEMICFYDFPEIYGRILCNDAETVVQEVKIVIYILAIILLIFRSNHIQEISQ